MEHFIAGFEKRAGIANQWASRVSSTVKTLTPQMSKTPAAVGVKVPGVGGGMPPIKKVQGKGVPGMAV